MIFNSYIFILCYLPILIIGYFALCKSEKVEYSKVFIIIMSMLFYAWCNIYYLLIFLISIFINYIAGIIVYCKKNESKYVSLLPISVNVITILYFKYYNFFIDNLNNVININYDIKKIILPLGISFFTFQQISYIVDIQKGEIKNVCIIDYLLYITFFPKLVSGPIVKYNELIPQFNDYTRRIIDLSNLNYGIFLFSVGLFKKVVVAELFSKVVLWGFTNTIILNSFDAMVVAISYSFQLYFDFSGYCDMAVAVAKMINIDLPQNFNSPYKACSISEFWDRWHISLSQFLKEYIYFPLGGSKNGKIKTYINVLIVFLISGIWHGANWTYIVWGLLHGVLNCIDRLTICIQEKIPRVIRRFITFVQVSLLWVIFRSDNLTQAKNIIRHILVISDFFPSKDLVEKYTCFEIELLQNYTCIGKFIGEKNGLWMFIIISVTCWIIFKTKNTSQYSFKCSIYEAFITIILLVWSMLSFNGVSEFYYFNF